LDELLLVAGILWWHKRSAERCARTTTRHTRACMHAGRDGAKTQR
jgi:hypothetical protein